MILTSIKAKTLPEAWFLCIKELVERAELIGHLNVLNQKPWQDQGIHIYTIDHGSFGGRRRLEFDYVTVHIEYPGSRPLVPDVPTGVPPPSTQEYVEGYLPYLMTGKKAVGEDYTYGKDLEEQIPQVIEGYKKNGFNQNQMFMDVGSKDSMHLKDPQCLRMIDTRIQDGRLHFIVYFRSWDLWAGFPSNLAAIQILKEYMASEIGVNDGELVAASKGLHLYDLSWEYAKLTLGGQNT
jgi:thymidylate synthase